MNRLLYILLIIITIPLFLPAQVVINEACPANLNAVFDEDNDAEDWIELYNKSRDTLSLDGFYLSDKKSESQMWKIPDVTIYPDSFVVFFASGKDRIEVIDHWETAVYCDSLWRYLNPDYEPDPQWKLNEYCDTAWNVGRGGFGFGDDDDTTVMADTLRTFYLRKTFTVSDTSKIINAVFHADYDDGFVVYLNGKEIIRENIFPDGKTPHYQQTAMFDKEAVMIQGGRPTAFPISKDVLKRNIHNGENLIAIQCHNVWDGNDMTMKPWLSFSVCDTSHQFGSLPEWFFAPELKTHTNFSISSSGEKIYLFSPGGLLLHELAVPAMPVDVSYGLAPDGGDESVCFMNPTPGYSNDTTSLRVPMPDCMPVISPNTGFYKDSVLVGIVAPDTGFVIRYTLDGSPAISSSAEYLAPFYINSTTVVRAALFSENQLPSRSTTQTLFVDDSSSLRVVSVATRPDLLWDEDYGIYVKGTEFWVDRPFWGANFWDDTEIPVNIDLYDNSTGERFSQDCGLKIHGGWTRSIEQKSIRPMAKGKYGEDYFKTRLFKDKPQSLYKRFVLRNAGNDHYSCFFRDAFSHRVARWHTFVDVLEYEPVLVYINGEYWGIQNMREKVDRYYLESNYGYDPEKIDLLEEQGDIISGDNKDFLDLIDFVATHDLSQQDNFEVVQQKVDLASFTDLFALDIFFVNTDWPHNNMKWWRNEDGPWQYILLDLDVTSSLMSGNHADKKQLERVSNDSVTMNAVLFTSLLENIQYRNYFINRYADLMNFPLHKRRLESVTDSIVEVLRPEMARHKERWGSQTVTSWENYYVNTVFKGFINNRHSYARNYMEEFFSLENQVELCVQFFPPDAGHLHINTIYPDTMPFTGVYFNPVPVVIEALPAPGYEFAYWKNSDSTWASAERIYQGVFSVDDTLIAVFQGAPDTARVIISEIMHSPHPDVPCGNWIELYSFDDHDIDISGWRVKLNHQLSGQVPEGIILPSGEYLILASDTSAFYSVYSDTIPTVEISGMKMHAVDTELSLLDEYRNTIITSFYGEGNPWPDDTFFTGRSNDLIDVSFDPQSPDSWGSGCLGGSPGGEYTNCHDFPDVIFTEYNCSSCDCHDCGDWVEIYNNDSIPVDMTDWVYRDNDDDHAFLFPQGYVLDSGAYAVIARDPVKFAVLYPEMPVLAPFDFGLGDDDSLLLFNRYGYTIAALGYTHDKLWPNNIYGSGRTAELLSPDSLIHKPLSWKNGCYGGTPMAGPATCKDSPELIVSEIQYHPHEKYDGGTYFEVFNRDTFDINLNGWAIIDNDSLISTIIENDVTIDTSSYLVFAQNPDRFRDVFPESPLYNGSTGLVFASTPNAFGFQDKYGITRLWMAYDVSEPWPVIEDSTGKALELLNYQLPYNIPDNWFIGCKEGSPGHEYRPCDTTGIVGYSDGFVVSPNPFSDYFYLENPSFKCINRVRILSSSGAIVFDEVFRSQLSRYSIDAGHLTEGIYILEVFTRDYVFYRKVVRR